VWGSVVILVVMIVTVLVVRRGKHVVGQVVLIYYPMGQTVVLGGNANREIVGITFVVIVNSMKQLNVMAMSNRRVQIMCG
jgi:hypothetical protein